MLLASWSARAASHQATVHGSAGRVIPFAQAEQLRDRAENAVLVAPIEADHYQPVHGNERPHALAASEEVLTTFFDVHVAGVAGAEDLGAVFAEQGDRISVR